MNERDTIPPAEKLAQFEEPEFNAEESIGQFTNSEFMARVAKLLGMGLQKAPPGPGNGPVARPEPGVCTNCGQWQHRSTGDCFNECAKRGFAKYDQWAERREAFSNEGEVEP